MLGRFRLLAPLLFTFGAFCAVLPGIAALPACASPADDADPSSDQGEPADSESAIVPITEADETAPAAALAAASLDAT
jgi:hypothetical protein